MQDRPCVQVEMPQTISDFLYAEVVSQTHGPNDFLLVRSQVMQKYGIIDSFIHEGKNITLLNTEEDFRKLEALVNGTTLE